MAVVTVAAIAAAIGTLALRNEEVGGFLLIWLVHVALAIVPTALIAYFGRKLANWQLYDLGAFVLPYAVWVACMAVDSSGKSLGNLVEAFYLSAAIPIAAIGRIAVATVWTAWICSLAFVLALCIVAVAIYELTPGLPE